MAELCDTVSVTDKICRNNTISICLCSVAERVKQRASRICSLFSYAFQ